MEADSRLGCHTGSGTIERQQQGVKKEAAAAAQIDSVYNRKNAGFSRVKMQAVRRSATRLRTRRDDTPSCLFSRRVAPCRTLSISSPAWKTHTTTTVRGGMRLLTCRNQTMANVSPAQITFTIGVSSLSPLMHCGTEGLYSAGLGGGRTD